MAQEQLPELHPGWTTVRRIGAGSFGAVYEIQRDLFGKTEKAALKYIHIPHSDDEIEELYGNGYDDASITAHFKEYLADIVREYSLMAEMKGHTNVVYCDDIRYIQHDDGFGWDIYIKMELLTPMLKMPVQAFSEKQVIRLGMDICRALMLCRDKNIVHRDIKPQNILVSETGDYKLGDFGIAKTVERSTGGTKTGTIPYMAPEVYHNQPYGSRADIYSLGLVMYWLMNERRLPFLSLPPRTPTAKEAEEARVRRLSGEAIPAPKNGSEELKAIVLKACAFEPEDRFQSAEEMLNALCDLGQKKPAPQPKPEPKPEPAPQPQPEPVKEDETVVGKPVPKPVRKPESEPVPVPEPDDETVAIPQPKSEIAPGRPSVVRPAADKKTKWASAPLSQVNPSSEAEEPPKEKKKLDLLAVVVFGVFFYLVVFVPGSFFRAVALVAAYVLFALYREWFRKRNPYTNIYRKMNFWIPVICVYVAVIILLAWFTGKDVADISAGYNTTAALYDDGTVDMTGDYAYDVENWENMIQISVGSGKILGLCDDGTVVMRTYLNETRNAFGWTDIEAIAAGSRESLGLRDDGSVVIYDHVYGMNIETGWSDVIAVAVGDEHSVALREDGTVVATGSNAFGQCNVSKWTDIVAISAGLQHTVGLKSDGTVIATGDNEYGQCNVEQWTDIVAVAAGGYHTVGLKADGTVVAVGNDSFGQCDVSDWKNILAISAGGHHTVALKSNGALVAVGNNYFGECNVKELRKN